MNPMQELAIKYPTLWEHIAKGGKVRGYQERHGKISDEIIGIIDSIDTGSDICIYCIDDQTIYDVDRIELLPLPKRVPTKDLGKAVN